MAPTTGVTHREISQAESAATLSMIVEMVRRIMKADVASILTFSLLDDMVTWKASSGYTTEIDYTKPLYRPVPIGFARQALEDNDVAIVQGIGHSAEIPPEGFPVHAAEGVCDLAIAPMQIVGDYSGALVAGYRQPHDFSGGDRQLLQNLAEMATVVLDSARLVESIETAKKIWEQTFDAIDEGMLVYDAQERIIRCNTHAAEMMDAQVGDVLGISFAEAFRRLFGQRAADFYLPQARPGISSKLEVMTDFERRFIVAMFPIERADGGAATVVTVNDVTRVSEIQEQLARSRRLGSVGQLAAGVAHEINNPLAAISTCAEAVMRDVRKNNEAQRLADEHQWTYYLEEIVRQAQRCKEITRGLLDLTQQRRPKRSMSNLNAIARDCIKVAVQQPESARIEFQVVFDEQIGEVATDAAMIRQILDNLLSNAIDALTASGGAVTVTTAGETDRALIEVADNGQGIPAGLLPRIFDPFVSTKGPGKRYGLGLAICAALAEALGASLTVESKEGEGSKFRLWIPRRSPEKADLN